MNSGAGVQPAPEWELSLSATRVVPGLDRILLTDLTVLATSEQLAASLITQDGATACLGLCLRSSNNGSSRCIGGKNSPTIAVSSDFSFIHYSHFLKSNERSVKPRACTSEQF